MLAKAASELGVGADLAGLIASKRLSMSGETAESMRRLLELKAYHS
jgi:hypothetical protein